MSLPIIELIAVDILAAINDITKGNGFNQTLNAHRPTLTDYSDVPRTDLNVMILQGTPDKQPEATDTNRWLQPFELVCWVINSNKSAVTYETRVNQVVADIQKKLMEDWKRDGNAMDTILQPPVPFNDDEGSGVRVFIDVDYRVEKSDPYTKA